jgi:hypothetical protein
VIENFTGVFWGIRQLKTQKTLLFRQFGKMIRPKKNIAADLQSRRGTAGKLKIRKNIKN